MRERTRVDVESLLEAQSRKNPADQNNNKKLSSKSKRKLSMKIRCQKCTTVLFYFGHKKFCTKCTKQGLVDINLKPEVTRPSTTTTENTASSTGTTSAPELSRDTLKTSCKNIIFKRLNREICRQTIDKCQQTFYRVVHGDKCQKEDGDDEWLKQEDIASIRKVV